MIGELKPIVWTALGQILRHVPLAKWPAWVGDLYDIKVPLNIHQKPSDSPDGGANINILLELMDMVRALSGDFAECGVFRGSTLISVALYAHSSKWNGKILGFDSFAGFDDAISIDLQLGGMADSQKRHGGFSGTSMAYVADRIKSLGLADIVEIHQGYFEQTLHSVAERWHRLVHIDCDIYASYKQCLEYFYPRMVSGGIILLDEYNDPPWPGCKLAVDEFLADRREDLQMISRDGYEKYYIVKG